VVPFDQASPPDSAFYFDLASPECYLAAERVLGVLPRPLEWQPVLSRELPGCGEPPPYEQLERRARELGVQPLRLPAQYPFDSEKAMLVATYAKGIGRVVAFAQAAFRQAFAGAHSLAETEYVLIAAAACEMHPAAVLKAIGLQSVRERLTRAAERARRAGVTELPAIRVGGEVFLREAGLDDAAAHLRAQPAEALAR
jgi:2-hydroxychromene-2-carboxylate isomerase